MSRTFFLVAGALGASGLLLVDSAVKGTMLLLVAAAAAIILRRDSAATRHWLWMLSMVAMLAVPLLSAMLPQWRVLPDWMGVSAIPAVAGASLPLNGMPEVEASEASQPAQHDDTASPPISTRQPAAARPTTAPTIATPEVNSALAAISAPTDSTWQWLNVFPFVWLVGFCLLIVRLFAARWMLWKTERQGTVLRSSMQSTAATLDPLVVAFETACRQLEVSRSVVLLIHSDKTIPVVWGILRCRLLLPVVAREWSSEQLRSVLLHELAHIKRRDTLAQLLTQFACALHWFNPLVWIAAWRLGVERERACDDLVLASGVRPSAYAGHLLDVVTASSPARWTQACGLAMARKSSIEGRLVAVLSDKLNRRGVPRTLAAAALLLGIAIAVPVAMLRAQEGKPAEKPTTAVTEMKPTEGTKLQPNTEQKLKWGEPTNGLRMALAWPPTLGEAGMGDAPEFYLVVQNVSAAAVRFTAGDAAPNPRRLMMRDKGSPLQAIRDPTPMPGDWLLQPREVAFVRLFQQSEKAKGGRITSAVIEDNIRSFPQYSMTAEMSIEKAPAGAWTGKLATGETRGSMDVIPPKHKDAQALLKSWMNAARVDGKIPGAVIGMLGEMVKLFIKSNPTWETTPRLEKMLPRFDATHDWLAQDAVALLDDLAAAQDTPIAMALDFEMERVIRTGSPLPKELAVAPWGEALSNGLRMAWLLEPRAAEHRLGTPLKSRILIHNASKTPIVFRTRTWHQGGHTARDAKGAEIKVDATTWFTRAPLVWFRLAPGEYIELSATGIGVGAMGNSEDWQHTRVGSWIEAKAGDDVTVTTDPVPLNDWNEKPELDGEPRWWLDFITARVSRHLPFPADAAARELLLYRVAMELFGTPVSNEIRAAFVADRTPTALDSLAKNLHNRPGLNGWAGPLSSGPTKFRVLPADADAAKRPRTASNPGHYTLAANASFVVTRRPVGERLVNEAYLSLSAPAERHEIKLPDGYNSWAAAWVRGGTVMWITEKGLLRKVDFSKPAKVDETRFEADKIAAAPIPPDIREALRAALAIPDAPKQPPTPPDAPPAASPPADTKP